MNVKVKKMSRNDNGCLWLELHCFSWRLAAIGEYECHSADTESDSSIC